MSSPIEEAFALAARREEPHARKRAVELLEGLIAAGSDTPSARFLLASLYDDHADGFEQAIVHYRKGLEKAPHDSAARNNLAVALMATGQHAEALSALCAVLRDDPGYGLAAFNLALVAHEQLTDDQLRAVVSELEQGGPEPVSRLLRAMAEVGRQEALGGVYGKGHALKNLLGLAGSRLKALSKKLGGEAAVAEAAQSLEKLYDDWNAFLKAARAPAARRERCELNALAQQVARSFPPGEEPKLSLSPHPLSVIGDAAALREAILNLARNAREAAPAGTVELRSKLDETGRWVHLSVADNGPGISPQHLRRIFAEGFSTKARGSGFGLSIAERIAHASGGRIEVESRPGEGAVFTLVLPVASDAPPRLAPRLSSEEFTR